MTQQYTVRIWDLPTRIFHWALAVCVPALIVSAKVGGNAMQWHMRLGHVVLALLLFRLVWGLVGGRWSRFAAFLYSPAQLLRYLRGAARPEDGIGHSPLGALSVFAMLAVLAAQVGSGLMSDDEIAFAGALAHRVPNALVEWASFYHGEIGQYLVFALVGLHLLAIVFYVRVRKQRLVGPMIGGDKLLDAPAPPARDDAMSRLAALLLLAASGALSRWLWSLAAPSF